MTAANILGKATTKFELIRLPNTNRYEFTSKKSNHEAKTSPKQETVSTVGYTTRLLINQLDNKNKNLRNSLKIPINEDTENEESFNSDRSYIFTSQATFTNAAKQNSKLPSSRSNKLVHYTNNTGAHNLNGSKSSYLKINKSKVTCYLILYF